MAKIKERTEADIRRDIAQEFKHWEYIHDNGCRDPFWADGVNLNLTRNHIIWHYKELAELGAAQEQLSLFSGGISLDGERPIPPIMPTDYMAPHQDFPNRLICRRRSGNDN